MSHRHLIPRLAALAFCAFAFVGTHVSVARAQAQQGPLTSEQLLTLVRQLPKRPGMKEEVLSEIRRRGIAFTLTSGIRSVIATRSGNDADLRRTLEEAERRFLNPSASVLPSEAEASELLAKSRAASLEAAAAMPDFVVRQVITRAYAREKTRNWITSDRLTVGVSYRASGGEQYKLLALNGFPTGTMEATEKKDYAAAGGTSSTGEFVTMLALLFAEETKATFKLVDTDLLRGRRTLVYEYEVKQPLSKQTITYNNERTVVVGYRGRLWIDREKMRVLRIESAATDIPEDFPVTATTRTIDYEWVSIAGQEYLLPSRAVVEMTARYGSQTNQTRNDIRFRGYQKYGTEIKIIEEDIIDDETPEKKP
ncbi:MAG TPA: hypothetical protein VM934_08495 [Pyrinomonadaceae bacterium]|jgi:hypothetical protein|nr:hypothetical protein [Pyrinomonadaceae bacterium]